MYSSCGRVEVLNYCSRDLSEEPRETERLEVRNFIGCNFRIQVNIASVKTPEINCQRETQRYRVSSMHANYLFTYRMEDVMLLSVSKGKSRYIRKRKKGKPVLGKVSFALYFCK